MDCNAPLEHRPTTSATVSGWTVIKPLIPDPIEQIVPHIQPATRRGRSSGKAASNQVPKQPKEAPAKCISQTPSRTKPGRKPRKIKSHTKVATPELSSLSSSPKTTSLNHHEITSSTSEIARCTIFASLDDPSCSSSTLSAGQGLGSATLDFEPPQSAQCATNPQYHRDESRSRDIDHAGVQIPRQPLWYPCDYTAANTDSQVDNDTECALLDLAKRIEEDDDSDLSAPQRSFSDGWFNSDPLEETLPERMHNLNGRESIDLPLATNAQSRPNERDVTCSRTYGNPVILTPVSANKPKIRSTLRNDPQDKENEYSDPELDASMADLLPSDETQMITPQTSPQCAPTPKVQWLRSKVVNPVKVPSKSSNASPEKTPVVEMHGIQFAGDSEPLPFIRPPFPKLLLDRSPIPGLSNTTALRICFRVGEALNAASGAARTGTDAIIELYARVISSSRDGFKQHFSFADIFTDKPPYLKGVYVLWKGVNLWDEDAGVFLGDEGEGKICRVLGRLRREKGTGWEMNVLSIWGCSWEDLGVAKQIVCS